MNKLIEKVISRLNENAIEHEVIGNVIHTKLCTIEIWGWKITVNEKPVKLEEVLREVNKFEDSSR